MDENSISWEDDYRSRMNPELLTELLHEAVPVLKYISWYVVETYHGLATTRLPLIYESTNQHGTHQAALITIAADYTGGIAIATLLRGTPFLGVHPSTSADAAALWLVNMNITYKIPSTGDLTVSARIEEKDFQRIRDRFNSGKQSLEKVNLIFESEGESVATATFTYFLRQSRYLKPQTPDARLNVLFKHRLKASARLIAGVRATENSVQNNPLYSDCYSPVAAGVHGRLLAQRYINLLPQLREMVAARTKNIDDELLDVIEKSAKQIVFIGVGFDFRAFRLLNNRVDLRVYELDVPQMLLEREKITSGFEARLLSYREAIPINLELEDVNEKLLLSKSFDPSVATFFIFEGAAMYFEEDVNRKVLKSIRRTMANSESTLWVDIVAKSVIEGTSGYETVEQFIKGMEKLGEPFIFGLDDPTRFFAELGLNTLKVTPSGYYNHVLSDPVFDLYNFHLLSPAA